MCFLMSRTTVSGVRNKCGEMMELGVGGVGDRRQRLRAWGCLILKEIGKDG